MLCYVIHSGSRLHVVWGHILFFADVVGAAIMAAFAEAASFRACATVSNVDILSHCISLEASLCLNRGEQRIGDVLAYDSASSSNNARTGLDI